MNDNKLVVWITFFAAADEDAFEDNSEEYIRRDLEGSGNYFL